MIPTTCPWCGSTYVILKQLDTLDPHYLKCHPAQYMCLDCSWSWPDEAEEDPRPPPITAPRDDPGDA